MNIFISWSGERSHQVALLFKSWIKGVIQAAKPWVSSEDIASGTRWFAQISDQLDATSQGIICITRENKEKPWILYEAGALSKGQTTSTHVTPLLIDLETQDITGPLAQFNAVIAGKEESMRKLVLDLNKRLPSDSIIEEEVLKRVFSAFWPGFLNDLDKVLAITQETAPVVEVRKEESMIVEILTLVRDLDKRMKSVESVLPDTASERNKSHIYEHETRDGRRQKLSSLLKQVDDVDKITELINKGLSVEEVADQMILDSPELDREFVILNAKRIMASNKYINVMKGIAKFN
jgi:hypothetical protein